MKNISRQVRSISRGCRSTKRVMNNKKVSDHHAIIPTAELLEANLAGLKESEQKILFLISIHTVEAMEKEHIYLETSVEVGCGEEIFHAKGKKCSAEWLEDL